MTNGPFFDGLFWEGTFFKQDILIIDVQSVAELKSSDFNQGLLLNLQIGLKR